MKNRSLLCKFVKVIILYLMIGSDGSAMVRKLTFNELTAYAERIVVGRVREISYNWNSTHDQIYTRVVITVAADLKGSGDDVVMLTFPGGQVEQTVLAVSDMPVFFNEERVLLFLESGPMPLVGLYQGKYTLPAGVDLRSLNDLDHFLADVYKSTDINSHSIFNNLYKANEHLSGPAISSLSISQVSPSSVASGTKMLLTIRGSGFGDTATPGTVSFGQGVVSSNIAWWSDSKIICTIPVGACWGSGELRVTTASGSSTVSMLIYQYGYRNFKWAEQHPVVAYYVNNNCPGMSDALSVIRAAIDEWNGQGKADITLSIAGSTAETTPIPAKNSRNEIYWADIGPYSFVNNRSWYNLATGKLTETDIVFSNRQAWSKGNETNKNNLTSHALQNLGYANGLDMITGKDVSTKVMGIGYEQNVTILHADDIAGWQWIYGVKSQNSLPQIELIPNFTTLTPGQDFEIKWNDADPDNNALISFAYDQDGDPTNDLHTWIQTGLSEDPDGVDDRFVWSSGEMPGPGIYYVWAMIDDRINSVQYSNVLRLSIGGAPKVTATALAQGILLEWDNIAGATRYNVYSDSCDFIPDVKTGANRIAAAVTDQDPATPGIQWSDARINGKQKVVFYKVAGLFEGVEGAISEPVGSYKFDLTTSPTTDINEISIVFDSRRSRGVISTADELVRAIPNCTDVYYWDAAGQGVVHHPKGATFNDFPVLPGRPYMVNVTSPSVWTLTGACVDSSFNLQITATTAINHIFLPLGKGHLKNAEALANDIPGCGELFYWDVPGQGAIGHVLGMPFMNFPLYPGQPCYVNVSQPVSWPVTMVKPQLAMRAATKSLAANSFTGRAPHGVYGRVQPPVGMAHGQVAYNVKVWVKGREQELLTEKNVGVGCDGQFYWVAVSNFTTPWHMGDLVCVQVSTQDGSMMASTQLTLTDAGSDDGGKLALQTITRVTTNETVVPNTTFLFNNFPNPFNPSTEIRYNLTVDSDVRVDIYDISGRRIRTLASTWQIRGLHRIGWDGTDENGTRVASGLYLCRFSAGAHVQTIKLVLAK